MLAAHLFYNTNLLLTAFLLIAPQCYLAIIIYLFRHELRKSILQVSTFFLFSGIFLNKLLFTSVSLAQKDFNNIQVPFFVFFKESIAKYFLPPIWNSSFCGGVDVFSNPLAGYFSMFNWVFLIGDDIYRSFGFFIFFQIVLCGIFAYLMLRTFKFSRSSAVLGAVVFSFNGFVTMRLSPGVGLEYLYAYKWLPLILAFSRRYFDRRNVQDVFGLAIAFAFSFEGNPSMGMASGVMWLLYLFVEFLHRKNSTTSLTSHLKILLAPLIALLIYAVKLLPVVDLFSNNVARFAGEASGWRGANYDLYMFPEIFLPIKSDFTNGVFTPGVIAITIFLVGLLLSLVNFKRTSKTPFEGFHFAITTFILAFFITIENPVYYFLYSLPILNKLTIIPPFSVFYLVPIVFFCAYGAERLYKTMQFLCLRYFTLVGLKRFSKYGVLAGLVLLPSLIFMEVLLGPSSFGNKTYSFNFAKFSYKEEPYEFPHYSALETKEAGLFTVLSNSQLFIYPNAISLMGLKTLNSPSYFFGCFDDTELINAGLQEIKKHSDYIFSIVPLIDDELSFIGRVSFSRIKSFKLDSVFERIREYYALYDLGWNDDIYIYKVICTEDCSIKNLSNNPLYFHLLQEATTVSDISSADLSTSVNYSSWLRVVAYNSSTSKSVQILETKETEHGLLAIRNQEKTANSDADTRLLVVYANPYIYIGFGISLVSFLFIGGYYMRGVLRKEKL